MSDEDRLDACYPGTIPDPEIVRLRAEVERLRRERDDWRHAAEKGAALCRAVTNDLMDDMDWFDSAKDLYDEVISLAAKAKIAAVQSEKRGITPIQPGANLSAAEIMLRSVAAQPEDVRWDKTQSAPDMSRILVNGRWYVPE